VSKPHHLLTEPPSRAGAPPSSIGRLRADALTGTDAYDALSDYAYKYGHPSRDLASAVFAPYVVPLVYTFVEAAEATREFFGCKVTLGDCERLLYIALWLLTHPDVAPYFYPYDGEYGACEVLSAHAEDAISQRPHPRAYHTLEAGSLRWIYYGDTARSFVPQKILECYDRHDLSPEPPEKLYIEGARHHLADLYIPIGADAFVCWESVLIEPASADRTPAKVHQWEGGWYTPSQTRVKMHLRNGWELIPVRIDPSPLDELQRRPIVHSTPHARQSRFTGRDEVRVWPETTAFIRGPEASSDRVFLRRPPEEDASL